VDDVEDALAWCAANLADRGADVNNIVLAGHSAGAILSAHVCVRQDWLRRRNLPLDLIKACVPISGMFDFRHGADYVADPSQLVASSPLLNVSTPVPRTVVAYGERERSPQFAHDSQQLVATIRAHGAAADLLMLPGHDHADAVNALCDTSSPLFRAVESLYTDRAVS
jgi:arylformamidase